MREKSCLSDLALDRIVADGEPGDSDQRHLDGCPRCVARLQDFRSESAAARQTVARLVAAAADEVEADASKRSSWWPRFLGFTAVAVTACLALVGLWSVQPTESPLQTNRYESLRAKGTNVRLFVRRDGVVYPGREVDRFRAGDELRFSTSNTKAAYFMLVGIGQESGRVTVYHPFQGESSAELPPGTDVPLPGSLVLDESPETELYLAAFTNGALMAAAVRERLTKTHAQGARTLSAYQELELPGSHHWFEIRRE